MAASMDIVFTLVYFLLSMFVIFPPTEVISAGLTVETIFSSLLGSEDMLFVHYHIIRTALTAIVHSFLPFGYCISSEWFYERGGLVRSVLIHHNASWYAILFLLISVIIPVMTIALVYYWSRDDWRNHPISQELCKHGRPRWQATAGHINTEFRRVDKFMTGVGNISRVIVTDSWLLKVTRYFVYVAHQSDVDLSITSSEQHDLSHVSSAGVQFLNIKVSSRSKRVTPFHIRLNSMEYGDLRQKLTTPISNARNIVIKQTIAEQFVEAFREQVGENPKYSLPPDSEELEQCIGCMQTVANVKLQKLCDDSQVAHGTNSLAPCVQCYCRPMWCLECMGKWFASRQDQSSTELWLSSKSPCPTCRSVFCLLDVSMIE